jgi:HAD superfamily hydrolase (TIGR01509 family)
VADLHELLGSAKCVLFDFDGPVCRLFAGRPAVAVADRLRGWLVGIGEEGLLSPRARTTGNPLEIVGHVARTAPGSPVSEALEERLTKEEKEAAVTAEATPHADALIQTLVEAGLNVAVTTNNSPRTVRSYLARRQLDACFGAHIYGRGKDAARLKPDPYCLEQALNALDMAADAAIMIGDAVADLRAARSAGVPFVGYATGPGKAIALRQAGADAVLMDLYPMLREARALWV